MRPCEYATVLKFKLLYTYIDLKLLNKYHERMHHSTGVTCVYTGHTIYTL